MKISREAKIGIIVSAGLVIFLFGLNFLKGTSLITPTNTYYAVYDKVDGIKVSNPIMINGFQVGRVADISLMPDNSGRLLVTLSFSDKTLKITKGSIARIVSSDLLGSKIVEFVPVQVSELHQENDTLKAEVEQALTEMLTEQIDPVKNKLITVMAGVDTVLGSLQGVLTPQTVNDINQSFGGIKGTILSLENTAAKLDNIMASQTENLKSTLANIEKLSATLAKSSKSIEKIINNMGNLSDSLAKANIIETLNAAKSTLESTDKIVSKINKGEGSIGMLINNDSLHNQLVSSTKELENLFKDMQAHPGRYVHFSVFGKKEKGLTLSKTEEDQLKLMLKSSTK